MNQRCSMHFAFFLSATLERSRSERTARLRNDGNSHVTFYHRTFWFRPNLPVLVHTKLQHPYARKFDLNSSGLRYTLGKPHHRKKSRNSNWISMDWIFFALYSHKSEESSFQFLQHLEWKINVLRNFTFSVQISHPPLTKVKSANGPPLTSKVAGQKLWVDVEVSTSL